MQPKELITIGVVAVGGIGVLIYVASQQTTTTKLAVDPNAAATENNIIAANTTAANTQASETVALAQLATGYETTFDNNQTAVTINGQNTTAATTINYQNNSAQTAQVGMAANATYKAALLDTAAKIESTLSNAQTAQYTSYVTGQTALAGDAATTTDVGLQTAASQAIAGIQGTTATNIANITGATEQNIAQIQGTTATNISGNETTVAVNAADQQASASKSNGFWNALSGIFTGAASIFTGFNVPASSGSQVDSSNIPAASAGIVNVPAPTFSNFGPLPTINWPQMSGNPTTRQTA